MTASADAGVTTGWRPILVGDQAQRALQAVDVIAEAMAPLSPDDRDPSLAGGQAGLAILDAWTFHTGIAPQGAARAWKRLDDAFETVAAQPIDASFYGGFTGVAWASDLVDRLLDPAGGDRNEEVDEILLRLLARPGLSHVPHDLVLGVTGLGVYALQRHPRPRAVACLRRVVDQLRGSARHDEDGSYWWTPPEGVVDRSVRQKYPSGYVDLGVAHGMAGTIALLGAAFGVGIERATVRPLLAEAVRGLGARAVATQRGPTYPSRVTPQVASAPARCAWCYVDPGIAAALLLAADRAGEPAWRADAVALACRAADRHESDTGVVDAGFCHGTAGLAHLYNRMYQATGEPALRRAAVDWLERTLEFYRLATGNGRDWVQGTEDRRSGPWTGLDIVDGAAGIALVLLAAATPVEPTWDRMFLVSAPDGTLRDTA
jgi:hypothetical protein